MLHRVVTQGILLFLLSLSLDKLGLRTPRADHGVLQRDAGAAGAA